MKKIFNYKHFIVNVLVLLFFLGIFIIIQLQAEPISPTIGYYLSPILFILLGIFFNQSKVVSLFQEGQLIMRMDYLILSIVFFLLLFIFLPIPALRFRITFLMELLRVLHLDINLLMEPILAFGPKLVPLFLGYFTAGTVYKVKE